MRGPNRGSGPRSGLYAESRFTNWAPYDPFWSEIESVSADTVPTARLSLNTDLAISIFVRPLAVGFTRPFDASDVEAVLRDVPVQYLRGLEGVFLLGGTAKQSRIRSLRFGTYSLRKIYLHPLPEAHLRCHWHPAPKPSVVREYTRFGAEFKRDGARTILCFTDASLRSFYLYDVLLHEIGHHNGKPGPTTAAERFATWFADYQASQLRRLRAEGAA